MEWQACSHDLNFIENMWDALRPALRACSSPPVTLGYETVQMDDWLFMATTIVYLKAKTIAVSLYQGPGWSPYKFVYIFLVLKINL